MDLQTCTRPGFLPTRFKDSCPVVQEQRQQHLAHACLYGWHFDFENGFLEVDCCVLKHETDKPEYSRNLLRPQCEPAGSCRAAELTGF